MMIARPLICGALLLAAELSSNVANADEGDVRAASNALFDRTAASYEIYRDQERTQSLLLCPEPVYKWKAASAGNKVFGSVYVWTYRGCAEAVACIWRSSFDMAHEAHGLSTAALNPVRAGHSPWRPTAGLVRHPLPGASPPAEKSTLRLAEMRRLSGGFTAHTEAENGERRERRVLSAPVYRYESSDPQVIDGGVFALVCTVGTDPEAFLVLEARQADAGPRWHYAFARFSHLNLFASYEGERVWESVRGGIRDNADRNYYLVISPLPALPVLPEKPEVPQKDDSSAATRGD